MHKKLSSILFKSFFIKNTHYTKAIQQMDVKNVHKDMFGIVTDRRILMTVNIHIVMAYLQ